MSLECGNCARPVADGAALCTTCATGLGDALREVPDLLDDLLVTLSRQDRMGAGGKAGSPDEQPAPRLDASRTLDALVNEVTTWARELAERHHLEIPMPVRLGQDARLHSAAVAADWLADHVGLVRSHPAALEAHDGITGAIAAARRRVDRPVPLAYRGPCGNCGAPLYATPGAAHVTCSECRETYDDDVVRAWLLEEAADQLVTTAELSAALTGLSGETVKVGTIRSWRSRGKIAPHAWVHLGQMVTRPHLTDDGRDQRCCRALYRVGDATGLLGSPERH